MLTILLALLAAAMNAGASVLQRKANIGEVLARRTGLASLANLLKQPLWLAGLTAVIASFLLQAAALGTGELSEVQPLMSLELPITLLLASVVFHQGLGVRNGLDIAVMTAGMALFLFALHPTEGSPGAPSGLVWALGTGATGGAVVVLAAAGYVVEGRRRAAVLGVGSGIAFALTAVFMSDVLAEGLSWQIFTRWQTYLVVVAGLAAMLLLQEGLQAGTLLAVQPGVTLSDPMVAIVLGVLLFDERVRTGWWTLWQVIGAVAVGWGAIALSRSPLAGPDEVDAGARRGRTPEGGATSAVGPNNDRRG